MALLLGLGIQGYVLLARVDALQAAAAEARLEARNGPPARIDWDFLSPEIELLHEELSNRLAAVGQREQELREYEKRLQAEKAEIEKLKREIEGVREDLANRLIAIAASEEKNLKNLAATYSGMEPAAALAIFREMDDEMVVKILAFMKPEPVGNILQMMARTKDGEGTLAGRAAALSYKLRLLNQDKPADNT